MSILGKLLSSDAYTPVNKMIAQRLGFVCAGYFGELFRQRERFGIEEFFFSDSQMMKELGFTKWEMQSSRKKLKDLNLITVKKVGVPAKNYYTINDNIVLEWLNSPVEEYHPLVSEIPATSDTNTCHIIRSNNKNNNNIKEDKSSSKTSKQDSSPVYEKRTMLDIVNDYDSLGTFDITELASQFVLNEYTDDSLKKMATIFLDHYNANRDKFNEKANVKSRFNQFVQRDYKGVLQKKTTWAGIDNVTDEQFIQYLEDGHFKTPDCPFYRNVVRPTLDTQGLSLFNNMISFFKNRHVEGYKGYTFKEWMIKEKRMIG